MLAALNAGLAMVPLIGFLEAIAIAKSFGELLATNFSIRIVSLLPDDVQCSGQNYR